MLRRKITIVRTRLPCCVYYCCRRFPTSIPVTPPSFLNQRRVRVLYKRKTNHSNANPTITQFHFSYRVSPYGLFPALDLCLGPTRPYLLCCTQALHYYSWHRFTETVVCHSALVEAYPEVSPGALSLQKYLCFTTLDPNPLISSFQVSMKSNLENTKPLQYEYYCTTTLTCNTQHHTGSGLYLREGSMTNRRRRTTGQNVQGYYYYDTRYLYIFIFRVIFGACVVLSLPCARCILLVHHCRASSFSCGVVII